MEFNRHEHLKPITKNIRRKIQSKSLKIITSKALNLLTFELLVKHRVGILMPTIYLEQCPACISDLFKYNLNIHPRNTRHRHHIHLPIGKHEKYVCQCTHIWNLIPDKLNINLPIYIYSKDN